MSNQTAAWGDIHADHKTEDADGTRWVLDHVDGAGTCLVRWHGPTVVGPDGFTRLAGERRHQSAPWCCETCRAEGWGCGASCGRPCCVIPPLDHPRHDFTPSFTGRVCDRMVLRDGHWDACGLPPEHPVHMHDTMGGF